MPYINQGTRSAIDAGGLPLTSGELNYTLTQIVLNYIRTKGLSYSTANDVMGVLACIQQELYRRWIAPYEDEKIKENGDVKL